LIRVKSRVDEMSFLSADSNAFYNELCRYGRSPQLCRGPKRVPDRPYIALLGGSETFGKFVERPFAQILEDFSGETCVNLGCGDLGLDALLADDDLLEAAREAEHVVVQILSAAHLTNPYYRVHPRRNDRLVEPSQALRRLFPEVDFTRYHFARHLLAELQGISAERFGQVAEAAQLVWSRKMAALLERLDSQTTLLWLRYDTPAAKTGRIGPNALLVTRAMVDELRPLAGRVVDIRVRPSGQEGHPRPMGVSMFPAPAVAQMIGQASHFEIAETLQRGLCMDRNVKKPA
jgi:hypothetical protein